MRMSVVLGIPLMALRGTYVITLTTLILVALLLMFLTLLVMAFLILWMVRNQRKSSQERNLVELAQADLLSKSIGLLSTKDPLAYQAVQAMDPVRSPEPESNDDDPLAKLEAAEQADDLMERFLYGDENLSEEERERLKHDAASSRFLNPADQFVR